MDGGRDAGDVSDADRRRQGRCQSLKVGEITVVLGIVELTTENSQPVPEVADLNPPEAKGRDEPGADQQHHQQRHLRRPAPNVSLNVNMA